MIKYTKNLSQKTSVDPDNNLQCSGYWLLHMYSGLINDMYDNSRLIDLPAKEYFFSSKRIYTKILRKKVFIDFDFFP